MTPKYMSKVIALKLLLCGLLVSQGTIANTQTQVERIISASEAEVFALAKTVSEALANETPMRVDKTTTLISSMFVSRTKSFIYGYQSTVPLEPELLKPYVVSKTCSSAIRRAFMERGLRIIHQYESLSGQLIASVNVSKSDCVKR